MRIINLNEFKKDFNIKEIENENGLSIHSQIEKIDIFKENNKKYLKRNYTKTEISEKYFPVPDSYIIQAFMNQGYFDQIQNEIEFINQTSKGGFVIRFKNEFKTELPVLDVEKTRGYYLNNEKEIKLFNNTFGQYKKEIHIKNSFDKTKSFSISLGLLRLVCSNGLYSFDKNEEHFISGNIKHLIWNKEKIKESVTIMLEKVPSLLNTNLSEYLYNKKITNEIKVNYFNECKSWLEEKAQKNQEKRYSYNHYFVLITLLKYIMDYGDNLLDFMNVLSYFVVNNRWQSEVKVACESLINRMKRYYK